MQGPILKLGWDQTHYRPCYIFLSQYAAVSSCSPCHSSLASEPFPAQVRLSLGLTLQTQNTLLKVWSLDTPQYQEDPFSVDIGAAGSTHSTHLPGSLPRLLRLIHQTPLSLFLSPLPLPSLLFPVLGKWTPSKVDEIQCPSPFPCYLRSCNLTFSHICWRNNCLDWEFLWSFPVPSTCGWFTPPLRISWLIISPSPCQSKFGLNFKLNTCTKTIPWMRGPPSLSKPNSFFLELPCFTSPLLTLELGKQKCQMSPHRGIGWFSNSSLHSPQLLQIFSLPSSVFKHSANLTLLPLSKLSWLLFPRKQKLN